MDPPSHTVEQMDTSPDQRFSRACADARSKHSDERHRFVLARQYAWLKDEMTFESVLYIADELVGAKDSANGYMSHQLCESIRESKRRQAVDLLLKHILNGPLEIYLVFLTLIEEHGNKHIAYKLRQTNPTQEEIEEFMELQNSSVGKCPRPNAEEARFTIRDDKFEELCCLLNVEAVIDSLNDFFLAKNWFSVREHTNISLHPMAQEMRLSCLLSTMKRCSYKILADFTEAMTAFGMQHVISNLNEHVLSAEGDDRTRSVQLLNRAMEEKIVSSVSHTPEQLRLAALKDMNFELESMETGSIIIRLRPVSAYSWSILKAYCQSGSIKNFIAKVYQNRAIYSLLKEGQYEIDVKIYTLDIHLKGIAETSAPPRLAEMHLKDHSLPEFKTDTEKQLDDGKGCTEPKHFIMQYFDVLCEEMGISNALLSYFEEIGLVDQTLKETVGKIGSRAEQVRCFLTHLLNFDTTGSERLLHFLKETTSNKALEEVIASYEAYERKLERQQRDLLGETDTDNQIQRKLFFSATAVLEARKNETTADFQDIRYMNEWEIRCSEILSPTCYFGTKKKKAEIDTSVLALTGGIVGGIFGTIGGLGGIAAGAALGACIGTTVGKVLGKGFKTRTQRE